MRYALILFGQSKAQKINAAAGCESKFYLSRNTMAEQRQGKNKGLDAEQRHGPPTHAIPADIRHSRLAMEATRTT